jgi:predicted pyridoxine 5'-phosphate oxidase superfamily flavin-nucleotide-binding protein
MIDFNGNRQYISAGNLKENHNVSLFLMNYKDQQRLNIWAETEI